MTTLLTNIDIVRARIMELESAAVFDQRAWEMVFADLRAAGRLSALADAERRMETARDNAKVIIGIVIEPLLLPGPVSVETEVIHA